ncbi:hypothetical protein [Pseudoalteromonas sp. MelDa3]|uniref:hypothetical protein n=1 Tax=Pseudoalteromonas sp. MelDa3 TaxID=888435 RepID=UPI000CC6A860|nr:hypothetical protein [Pseudoalteromonas sp. MelDa3]PLT24632.1 hypothetical protein CXF89_14625 [Pseudoalteromonas sp. MelDa3]
MDEKTLSFINKAKSIHGDTYSYDKSTYIGSNIKLTITCKHHGDFEQTPSNHFKYHCSKCSKEVQNKAKLAKASSVYLDKVIAVHDNKYDLSKVNYTGAKNKVTVVCSEHGLFEIRAQHFLAGSGCKQCGNKNTALKTIEAASKTFELKSRKVHGDRFDYKQVAYKGNTTKVIITCPEHGDYLQTPRKHLEGSGCHKCAIDNSTSRLSASVFIERAKIAHKNKYNYSKTQFTKSHEDIIITCEQHGDFSQNPHNHLAGAGCKLCANEKITYTTAEFIDRANNKHRSYYSYEKAIYVSSKVKVLITCPTHGSFNQKPILHLQGYGCNKCAAIKRGKNNASSTAEFIRSSNFIHEYKWNYDKTKYINNHKKVIITCQEHGDFEQTPGSHKSGKGCPRCGVIKSTDSGKVKYEEFLKRAKEAHGDKYLYDLVEYSSFNEKVSIKCLLHGVFNQSPASHVRGSGCPICGLESSREKRRIPHHVILTKAHEVHNFKYSYVEDREENPDGKLVVFCSEHGRFEQKIDAHLRGVGCPECTSIQRNMQTEEFTERSTAVHRGRYGYQYVDCNGTNSILKIECYKHGIFEQMASQHLKGNGCRDCYVDSTKLTLENYLKDCKKIHADKYDYSKLEYNTIRDKVIITCSTHGDFLQTAHDHKHGAGCPKCAEYFRNLDNKDPDTPCYLYYLQLRTEHLIFYKVGITTKGVKQRFYRLEKDNTEILDQFSILTTLDKAIIAEQTILEEFEEYRLLMSDTLVLSKGGTECFADDVLGVHGLELEDYVT